MDRRLLGIGLLLSALSCSARPSIYDLPSGDAVAPGDATSPVTCSPGMTLCNGNESYQCNAEGDVINRRSCGGSAPICVPGVGCRVCRPLSGRCDPTNAQQTQTCRADGMGYDNGVVCDPNDGRTCSNGTCLDRCSDSALGRSYLGCDYWPVTTANGQLDPQFEFAVVLSNPQTYPVSVTISGGALPSPRTLTLAPSQVQTVRLPWVMQVAQLDPANPGCRGTTERCTGGRIAASVLHRNAAYHVHSNGPIAAYQFNPLNFERAGGFHSFTNDASLLLPQGVLTTRYTVSTAANWNPAMSSVFLGGFVAIAAVTGESTTVNVRLTSAISGGTGVAPAAAGTMQTYRLQPGDVVQLVGTGVGDLTGTTIDATNPVAVFVGHDCTNVPATRPACDHLEEQLMPNETWGREYIVSALRDRGPTMASIVRIITQGDNAELQFQPQVRPNTTIRPGQVLEFAATQSFRVLGSRAILVSQFMQGQGAATTSGGAGDPAMAFEVPAQQYRSSYDIYVPETYTSNFLNVVAPNGAQIQMDGMPLRGSMEVLGSWAVYYLPIAAGPHHLQSSQAFGIKVYGIALYTSYMYSGGLDLQLITPG